MRWLLSSSEYQSSSCGHPLKSRNQTSFLFFHHDQRDPQSLEHLNSSVKFKLRPIKKRTEEIISIAFVCQEMVMHLIIKTQIHLIMRWSKKNKIYYTDAKASSMLPLHWEKMSVYYWRVRLSCTSYPSELKFQATAKWQRRHWMNLPTHVERWSMENQKGNLTIDNRHPDPDGDYISRLILPIIKEKMDSNSTKKCQTMYRYERSKRGRKSGHRITMSRRKIHARRRHLPEPIHSFPTPTCTKILPDHKGWEAAFNVPHEERTRHSAVKTWRKKR